MSYDPTPPDRALMLHLKLVPPARRKATQHIPLLIERYRRIQYCEPDDGNMGSLYFGMMGWRGVSFLNHLVDVCIERSAKFLLGSTTVAWSCYLARLLDPIPLSTLVLPQELTWMEFSEPLETPRGVMAGVHLQPMQRKAWIVEACQRAGIATTHQLVQMSRDEPQLALDMINPLGEAFWGTCVQRLPSPDGRLRWQWLPESGHNPCPTGTCRLGGEKPQICEDCVQTSGWYLTFLSALTASIQGAFATRATAEEEPAAQTVTKPATYTVHRSDKPQKKAKEPRSVLHTYTIIEMHDLMQPDKKGPSADDAVAARPSATPGTRGSWIKAAKRIDPAQVLYVEKAIEPFERRYQGYRYRRYIAEHGGELEAGVKGTVTHSRPKRVPVRADRLRWGFTAIGPFAPSSKGSQASPTPTEGID